MNLTQSEKNKKKAKHIVEKAERMKADRAQFESHWQECFDYIIPRKSEVTSTRAPGDKRGAELFDSTAIVTNQHLSGMLHGMLTNPATRFFELMFKDPILDSDVQVKRWLQEVGDRMFTVLNNTNFQTEVHEIYLDLGAIGTSCLYMGEDDNDYVVFSARAIKEILIEEDNKGRIDTVYRCFKWNLKQIIQEFGAKNLPKELMDEHQKGNHQKYEIIHAVDKFNDGDEGYEGEKSKYEYKSCYVLAEEMFVLHEKGFYEFPYAVPRWTKTSGEKYGRSPGMDCLPDIKMINKMMETTIQGAQMTVTPPMMVSDDGVIGTVRLVPRGLTVIRPGSDVPIKPLITDARVDFGFQAVEAIRTRIKEGFLVDQLNLSQNDRMTTVEVQQRVQENLRFMSPILGRQQNEFLRPVIDRLFGIMSRRGLFPPAPQQIQGRKFDIEYSSQVARAQRMNESHNFTSAINTVAPIVNADPKVMDNIDGDAVLKHLFDVHGIPSKILRTEREVADIRKAREDAQKKLAEQQQQMHQADVTQKTAPGIAALSAQNNQGNK